MTMLSTIPKLMLGPGYMAVVVEACPDCGRRIVVLCAAPGQDWDDVAGQENAAWSGSISRELSDCQCQRTAFAETIEVERALEVLDR